MYNAPHASRTRPYSARAAMAAQGFSAARIAKALAGQYRLHKQGLLPPRLMAR